MIERNVFFLLFLLNVLAAGMSPSSAGRFIDAHQGEIDYKDVEEYRVYAKERCEKYTLLKDELLEKTSFSSSLEEKIIENKDFLLEQLGLRLEKWKEYTTTPKKGLRELLLKKQKNNQLLSTENIDQNNYDSFKFWCEYFFENRTAHYKAYTLNIALKKEEEGQRSESERSLAEKIKDMLHADANTKKRESLRNTINNHINKIVNFNPEVLKEIPAYPHKLYIVDMGFALPHSPNEDFSLDHGTAMFGAAKTIGPDANVEIVNTNLRIDTKYMFRPLADQGVDKEDVIFNFSWNHLYENHPSTADLFNGKIDRESDLIQGFFGGYFLNHSRTFKEAYEGYKKSQPEGLWEINSKTLTLSDTRKAPLFVQEIFYSFLYGYEVEYLKYFLGNSKSIFCQAPGNSGCFLASKNETLDNLHAIEQPVMAAEFFVFPEMKERGIAVGNLGMRFKAKTGLLSLSECSNKAGDCADVFVMLPGNIYAYTYDDGFIQFDGDGGTSAASARLSSFANILNNLVPEATPVDVREAILRTAEIGKIANYQSNVHGQGILNFGRALTYLKRKFTVQSEREKKNTLSRINS